MAGTPIIIPTIPTKAAYYPGWPAFASSALGLLITYFGLWSTLRKLNKHKEKQDMPLPKSFWIHLPFDVARILAWFISFFRGLADMSQLQWINTIAWTVPFNYIFLFALLLAPPELEGSVPVVRSAKRARNIKMCIGLAIFLTVAQWVTSLAACYIHYKYSCTDLRAKLYTPHPSFLANPSSIAPNIPPACLDYISKPLPDQLFSSYSATHAFITQAIQFAFVTISLFFGAQVALKNNYRRTYTMLRLLAGAAQSALLVSALGAVCVCV
jgi:hypothetical protein